MKVELKSVGNPDFGQDPNRPMYGCEKNQTVEVKSLKDAQERCLEFIKENDLGGGNWAGGRIKLNGKLIGYVSYNGRVWDKEPNFPDNHPKEIKV